MIQLVLRIGVLTALNMTVAGLWLTVASKPTAAERWETDANLDVMPHDSRVEILFAGSSHGWALTACPDNAQVVADILGDSTLNLSKRGCGPLPALCYLEEFYARGNSADTLVYIVDPWALAYRRWNEDAPFLRDEPFEFQFWLRCAKNNVSMNQLAAALRAKFAYENAPDIERATRCIRVLDAVHPDVVDRRRAYLYPSAFRETQFARHADTLKQIAKMTTGSGGRVLFLIPPTLLGHTAGMAELHGFLTHVAADPRISWLDTTESLHDPHLFQDHDHLNAAGVEQFLSRFLYPAISGTHT